MKKKSKIISLILTLAFMAMLWPGAAYGAVPFISGTLNIDYYYSDTYIRVNVVLDQDVYGDAAKTKPVDKDDFEFVVDPNGGTVTKAAIGSMKNSVNTDVGLGDKSFIFNVYLENNGGSQVAPSGVETITLRPVAGAVFNDAGEAIETSQGLEITLPDRKKPAFAAEYPKVAADQPAGSKKIKVLVKTDEDINYYDVLLPSGSSMPTAQQLKDHIGPGADIGGVITTSGGGMASGGYEFSIEYGPDALTDNTNYDLYIALEDSAGNFSDVEKLSVRTPPPALAAPTGLAWDSTTPGKATWGAVTNAVSYSVQLYKGGTQQGIAISVPSGTVYDFTAAIGAAGDGTYTFTVTAIGDGTNYGDSQMSAASPGYNYTAPITDTTPPEWADVPLVAGDRHPGCKRVSFIPYPKDETVTAYYVIVSHGDTPPTKEQVKGGSDYDSVDVLASGSQNDVRTNGYVINPYTMLPADDTIYDTYVVIEDAAGNVSEPAMIELRTPVKLLADGYPKVGTPQAAGSKQVQILNQANGDSETTYWGGSCRRLLCGSS